MPQSVVQCRRLQMRAQALSRLWTLFWGALVLLWALLLLLSLALRLEFQ